MTVRPTRVALVLGAVLAVPACGEGTPQEPATSTTTAATPTASATPTPTPTPTPTLDTSQDVAQAGTSTLTAPASGAVLDGPTVTVSGTATAFEATLAWDVHPAGDLGGTPTAQGSATAGANGEVGPFSFTVDLPPGSWTVRVWEPDMRDGSTEPGPDQHLVSATFVVR